MSCRPSNLYKVVYTDGDAEELDEEELQRFLVPATDPGVLQMRSTGLPPRFTRDTWVVVTRSGNKEEYCIVFRVGGSQTPERLACLHQVCSSGECPGPECIHLAAVREGGGVIEWRPGTLEFPPVEDSRLQAEVGEKFRQVLCWPMLSFPSLLCADNMTVAHSSKGVPGVCARRQTECGSSGLLRTGRRS